ALRWMNASQNRMHALSVENARLRMKLEDEKVIARAKCILIECRGMTEPDAHAYIEKQAMNRRMTRREIANDILQSY
ncbi:MAG: ANTAR domain-containing response regulator, partial [Butyricicoccus sp.]